jgi:hypothetical protein
VADRTGIELARVGTWDLSTGPLTVTPAMLQSAADYCAAQGDAYRAGIKLGHTDPRFDGEPALGWLHNLRVEGTGDDAVLLGDVTGMPQWLHDLGPSAYPDRSVEGYTNFEAKDGKTWPFVIDGLAFLGITPPGMSTIRSLRDIPQALGVAASELGLPNLPIPFAASFTAAHDVAAADPAKPYGDVTYADPGYQKDGKKRYPLDTEAHCRAAWSYINQADNAAQYSSEHLAAIKSRITSALKKLGVQVAATGDLQTPAAEPVVNPPNPKGAPDMSDALIKGLRERLGITAELDEDGLLTALDEALAEQTPSAAEIAAAAAATEKAAAEKAAAAAASAKTPTSIPAGSFLIDTETYEAIKAQAAKGEQAYQLMAASERDRILEEAVTDGKFARSRIEHWKTSWQLDPEGAKRAIASMPKNLVPVAAKGSMGDPDLETDSVYGALFTAPKGA